MPEVPTRFAERGGALLEGAAERSRTSMRTRFERLRLAWRSLVQTAVAATAAYLLVSLFPVPAVLLLLMLLFGLIFGGRIAQGAASAPVYIVALTTFLIVLGLGLTPVADSGELFIERVFNVLVAAAYTIGVASVLRALFRAA